MQTARAIDDCVSKETYYSVKRDLLQRGPKLVTARAIECVLYRLCSLYIMREWKPPKKPKYNAFISSCFSSLETVKREHLLLKRTHSITTSASLEACSFRRKLLVLRMVCAGAGERDRGGEGAAGGERWKRNLRRLLTATVLSLVRLDPRHHAPSTLARMQ